MTRHFWVLIHRYAGLYLAFFLTVIGLTGSVLAFYTEINSWLNPQLYYVAEQAQPMLDPFTLRERALALAPQGLTNYVDLNRKPGAVYTIYPEGRTNPTTNEPYELDFDRMLLNPYTGAEIRRDKSQSFWPLTRENILPFIYALHYSLAVPESIGVWLFGIAALIWTLDCFVGFYLTLPATLHSTASNSRSFWSRWSVAWKVRWRDSAYRLNFDLHRAGGLWTWIMLFVFAWSGVAFNLGNEVYMPVMKTLFGMHDPTADIPKLPQPQPEPALGWREAHALGQQLMAEQATSHHFTILREQGLSYDPETGMYRYNVQSNADVSNKWGSTTIFFSATSGAFAGLTMPSGQDGGITFTTWITTLHMAGLWGIPMQIFVCCMGLVIAMLSVTGVYLWLKKRQAAKFHSERVVRLAAAHRRPPEQRSANVSR